MHRQMGQVANPHGTSRSTNPPTTPRSPLRAARHVYAVPARGRLWQARFRMWPSYTLLSGINGGPSLWAVSTDWAGTQPGIGKRAPAFCVDVRPGPCPHHFEYFSITLGKR